MSRSSSKTPLVISRRSFLSGGSALLGGAVLGLPLLTAACGSNSGGATGGSTPAGASAGGSTSSSAGSSSAGGKMSAVDYQIAWVGDNGVLGDVLAFQKGWYKEAGLDITFRVGGPSVDPVTTAASGVVTFSQTSSSPAIMLSRSQGVPIKAFAAGLQAWPWAVISKDSNPILKPADLIGKTIGTQSTGQILVAAMLKQNNIDPSQVNVQVVGSEVTPLVTGRIDGFTGWTTNLQSYAPLGGKYHAMTLGDAGIPSYANLYIATDDVIDKRADDLATFLAVTGRGWEYAYKNPDEATDLLLKQFNGLEKDPQLAGGTKLMSYMFDDNTAKDGWGTMATDKWQGQLDLWKQLDQFKGAVPTVDEVMTTSILDATAGDRPKVGKAS
jgi:NitT/TauT family transport system substrate-binding protein